MKQDHHLIGNFLPQSGKFGVLMSDLRGFTAITEQYPTLTIIPLLNFYFQKMTILIDKYGGRVDKYMGDSILAVFDMTASDETALSILSCSIDMQQTMDEVNSYGRTLNLPEIYMGIGVTAGNLVMCELGSDIYRELTVLGDPVNLVSRMAGIALRGQVLMSESVYNDVKGKVELGANYEVLIKGKKKSIKVYELQGLLYPEHKTIPVRENRRSPRVEALLPINYFCIENQRVRSNSIRADIADISYGGMRILTPLEHQLLDEIKVIIPFSIGAEPNSDVYAKVLSCTRESETDFCISVEFSYVDESATRSIKTLVDNLV